MKDKLRLEWQLFQLALRFLTCMPAADDLSTSDDLRIRAHKYFPIVGAFVGAIGALVFWASCVWLPQSAALIISLVATLLVTGAFHEDGLANAVEGMSRGSGRTQMLEMMASPGLGLFGALAVALVVALKLVLLAHMPLVLAGVALVLGHMIGMMAVVHVIATTPYVHSNGLQAAAPYITSGGYRFAVLSSIAVLIAAVFYMGLWPPLYLILGSIVLGQLFRSAMMGKLGGYNSDCLGGVMQLSEVGAYLGLSVWF